MSRPPLITEPIDNRIAAIAAKIFERDFYARRRLAAFIFRAIKQTFNAPHGFKIKTFGDKIRHAHFILYKTFKNRIEHIIGRQ